MAFSGSALQRRLAACQGRLSPLRQGGRRHLEPARPFSDSRRSNQRIGVPSHRQLSLGEHVIHFGGTFPDSGFTLDIT